MVIASPNLCLDRTQVVTELVPGAVLRALEVEVTAGGKGVNIARVVRAHGQAAALVGLVAENGAEHLLGLLRGEGADVVPVRIKGDVRMTTIMIERPSGRATVLNEPGPVLDPADWDTFRTAVAQRLPEERSLACAGSLPPGAPADAYGQLIELAHAAGVPALVDTAPTALRASLASGPDLVAPNLQEAEAAISASPGAVLADVDHQVRERADAAARALCALGARAAAVTAGAHGVALAQEGSDVVQWAPTVRVDVVSAVGAGDSFMAGVLLAIQAAPPGSFGPIEVGGDWWGAVLRGSATATASCEQLRAGGVDPGRVEVLLDQVRRGAAESARVG